MFSCNFTIRVLESTLDLSSHQRKRLSKIKVTLVIENLFSFYKVFDLVLAEQNFSQKIVLTLKRVHFWPLPSSNPIHFSSSTVGDQNSNPVLQPFKLLLTFFKWKTKCSLLYNEFLKVAIMLEWQNNLSCNAKSVLFKIFSNKMNLNSLSFLLVL